MWGFSKGSHRQPIMTFYLGMKLVPFIWFLSSDFSPSSHSWMCTLIPPNKLHNGMEISWSVMAHLCKQVTTWCRGYQMLRMHSWIGPQWRTNCRDPKDWKEWEAQNNKALKGSRKLFGAPGIPIGWCPKKSRINHSSDFTHWLKTSKGGGNPLEVS